jgi:hypothetical protein
LLNSQQLAAKVLGDAHARDSGRATATIVLAVCKRIIAPALEVEEAQTDRQHRSNAPYEMREERTRDVWARAGVLVNELARPAMCLNLPNLDDGRITQALGEPGYVSLRCLVRSPPNWAGRSVFVCENPNLLAIAADELGARCAPMVCTDGMPGAAQRTLLNPARPSRCSPPVPWGFLLAGLAHRQSRHASMCSKAMAVWCCGIHDFGSLGHVRRSSFGGDRSDCLMGRSVDVGYGNLSTGYSRRGHCSFAIAGS